MKTIGTVAFLLLFVLGKVFAQEDPAEKPAYVLLAKAVYYMTDMLDGSNSRMESWEVRLADGGKHMTTFKAPFKNASVQYARTDGVWWNEIRTEGVTTYLRERYAVHPSRLDPGERSYGHMEERNVADDKMVASWPIFYEVQGSDSMRRLIVHGFLPGNMHLVIVRVYWEGKGYFLPFQESLQMLEEGRTISYFVYARIQ